MMVVPEGCAHGFQTLEQDTELLYLHTADYCGAAEGGVRFDDAKLNIAWPLTAAGVSSRDQSHPFVADAFAGIQITDAAASERQH